MSLPKEPAYSVILEPSAPAPRAAEPFTATGISPCWIEPNEQLLPALQQSTSNDANTSWNDPLPMPPTATASNGSVGADSGSKQSKICSLPQPKTLEN